MAQQDATTSKLTRFNGGKSEDLRTQSQIKCSISKNFDIFTNEHRLIPLRDLVADETFADGVKGDYELAKFLYINGRFFGYGKKGANDGKASVFSKDAGGGNFLEDDWQQEASAGGNARIKAVFFGYKKEIYGFDTGGVWKFDTTSDTFTDSDVSGIGSVTANDVIAQPVLHPGDDIAYFFTNNKVHKNNAGSWTTDALVLPSYLKITSACAYGNYLAIGCAPVDQFAGNSVVFLWDRNASLTTVSAKIDWGSGELVHLCVLDGKLTGITKNSADFATASRSLVDIRQGQNGTLIKRIDGEGSFAGNGVVKDNRLYFPMRFVDVHGEVQQGVWNLNASGDLTIAYHLPDMDENTAPPKFDGIYFTANTLWVAHSGDGSISRTNDVATYNNPAIYETQIFTAEDSAEVEKLIAASVANAPLPSGAKVTLKYRKDEDINGGAWTTIFENTTTDSIQKTVVKTKAGKELKEEREVQFRIESTGGASPTQLKWVHRPVPKNKI